MSYLFKLPTSIPAGRVLVHNSVIPARRLGLNGFRAWLQHPDDEKLAPCSCHWAPELGQHNRVSRIGLRERAQSKKSQA
jgi:hypothetical protein